MASVAGSLSFAALGQCCERRGVPSSAKSLGSNSDGFRFRASVFSDYTAGVRASNSSSRGVVRCMCSATEIPPTVSDTKSNFLAAYKRPIPSIYNTVLQELLVQQHLTRYKKFYQYDPVFALGFVTVYDRLMEGYPGDEDREAIFMAYIQALNEDPEQYRVDALKLEEWARSQNADSLIEFSVKGGEVEEMLKGIAERAGGKGSFSYSRFFAVGLFRLLELANATDPAVLDKLCTALNVNKRSVDRDLDVYRNLLTKLVQAKELLKEYIYREKKKREERASESQKDQRGHHEMLGRASHCDTVMQDVRDLNHQPSETTLVRGSFLSSFIS